MSDDNSSQVLDALAPWKRKRFREYELSWVKAAESLTSDNPLVEIKSNKLGSRWTVYDKSTDKIAIFFHAGVWAWASPPASGNFVPEGEVAPPGAFEGKITPYLGRRAETNYAINTQYDASFHVAARAMEDHVIRREGFNKYKKPRRTWQNGETEYSRRRFIFASRLVIRKSPYNTKDGANPNAAPLTVHPWILNALKTQKYPNWVPNPDRPSIHDYVDGKLERLEPETSRYFDSGDIVWFSFALTFEINGDNWAPEYKPLDFIRVGHLDESPDTRAEYTMEAEVGSAYKSLTPGSVTLLDDDDASEQGKVDHRAVAGQKRGRDSDGDDTMESDGELSDISAYSAARAVAERKRPRVDGPASPPVKAGVKAEDLAKRRIPGKGKGKS
ncbi:hypothetical protein C8R47DRAFT_1208151 [Mycena vitilis]|nr:hypothetical protein C8R47DRAFT_1208151 [Mycena vitilis]